MQQRVKIGMVCGKANGHSSLMGESDYGSCGSHEVATIVIEGDTDIDLTLVAEDLADLVRRWQAAFERESWDKVDTEKQ